MPGPVLLDSLPDDLAALATARSATNDYSNLDFSVPGGRHALLWRGTWDSLWKPDRAYVFLDEASFTGTVFTGQAWDRVLASRCDFSRADLTGVSLVGCVLSGCVFSQAALPRPHLVGCVLSASAWEGADLSRAVFTGPGPGAPTSFADGDLCGADLTAVDASRGGLDCSRADVSRACFDGACLQRLVLTDATVVGTSFAGALIDEVCWCACVCVCVCVL